MLSEIGTALTDIVALMAKANQFQNGKRPMSAKEDEAQALATRVA